MKNAWKEFYDRLDNGKTPPQEAADSAKMLGAVLLYLIFLGMCGAIWLLWRVL